MKFFERKKFVFKLIASLCICLAIFNFGISPIAHADGDIVSKAGGKLLDPICSLLLVLGDGMMDILQKSVMGSNATAIFDNSKGDWWQTIAKVVGAVLVVVLAVVVAVATGLVTLPALLGAAAALALKVGTVAVVANILTSGGVMSAVSSVVGTMFGDTVVLPTFTIGPEEIFSGRILMFDPNIFDPKEVWVTTSSGSDVTLEKWNEKDNQGNYKNRGNDTADGYYYKDQNGDKVATSINNAAYELKGTISKWYFIIRNIAMVGLMLVLLYIGIRIIISSIAAEKAKYKQMLSDWVIALCLVFLMQYIMVFANFFVEGITNIVSSLSENKIHIAIIQEPSDKLVDAVNQISSDYIQDDGNGNKVIAWPTNLMGRIRVQAQQHDGTSEYVGYTLCYLVLVLFTMFFAFTYAKRLLYLMFLTVIAPLVALTYPLDKIRDGKAQAFDMWVKEYFINLIIQPFHLLLYIVFVSMAFELASTNIIYSLVALGFMIPAEKFLRNMFGFNKASSPGFLAGPAGAAMAISAVQSLSKFANRGGKNPEKGGSGKGSEKEEKPEIRTADSGNTTDSLLDNLGREYNNSPDNNDEDPNNPPPPNPLDDDDEDSNNPPPPNPLDDNDEDPNNPPPPTPNPGSDDSEEDDDSDDDETSEQQENKKKSSKVGGYIAARAQNFASRNFTKKKIAGFATSGARLAVKYGLGATAAGIGIAAGIATGSPGDVLKYGSAGAYAGASIGQGLTNRIGSGLGKAQQRHEEALKRQYGSDEYEEKKNKKLDDQFKKDKEMRELYSSKFDNVKGKDLDEIMKEACVYRAQGITDNTTIIRAMKLNEHNHTDTKSIAAAKLAKSAKTEKGLEEVMKRLGKRGLTAAQKEEMEKKIRAINREELN